MLTLSDCGHLHREETDSSALIPASGLGGVNATGGKPALGGSSPMSGGQGGNSSMSGGAVGVSVGGAPGPSGGSSGAPVSTVIGRNLFGELGKSPSEIDEKLNTAWAKLFLGDPNNERVFYEADADGGYILDTGNDDVRSEGMSYGMMIAVQMDQKATFDRLWRWTINHMRHSTGARAGYFAWQLGKDGQIKDPNPASDGEAYFATALLFARARWPSRARLRRIQRCAERLRPSRISF